MPPPKAVLRAIKKQVAAKRPATLLFFSNQPSVGQIVLRRWRRCVCCYCCLGAAVRGGCAVYCVVEAGRAVVVAVLRLLLLSSRRECGQTARIPPQGFNVAGPSARY